MLVAIAPEAARVRMAPVQVRRPVTLAGRRVLAVRVPVPEPVVQAREPVVQAVAAPVVVAAARSKS
jgi:hypothetical protein